MKQAGQDAGFSLIEVVVSLGILATAAISLSSLSTDSVRGAVQLEERYLARTVADTLMVDTFVDRTPLRIGVETGETTQMNQTFVWTRTVIRAPQDGLLLVEISISGQNDEAIIARTSALKLERPL